MSTPYGTGPVDPLGPTAPPPGRSGPTDRVVRALGRARVPTRALVIAVVGVWALAVVMLIWAVASATGTPPEPVRLG